jgi:multiple sugar transport system ATP-binding protein
MASITFKNVVKTYDNNVTVVPDLNLEIKDKEFIVLVGPSGCGKSTTLRMIAGLEDISGGDLYIGDRRVNDVPPKDRDIAMVFQSYALYPHMTVYRNMAFALEMRKMPKDEIDKRVQEVAKILELEEYLKRKPKELSGGQRQRVALGRAMVREPSVFLLDEPLSNLDAKLRTEMRSQIASLHKRLQTTFVYVTHDQTEAMTMGDRIVVMKSGVIQQVDTPQNLYHYPDNLFVAGFIGSPQMNFVTVGVEQAEGGCNLVYGNCHIFCDKPQLADYVGKEVTLGVRPEDLHCEEEAIARAGAASLKAHVDLAEMMGSEIYLYLTYQGQKLVARVSSRMQVEADEDVILAVDASKIHVFDPESEKIICHASEGSEVE